MPDKTQNFYETIEVTGPAGNVVIRKSQLQDYVARGYTHEAEPGEQLPIENADNSQIELDEEGNPITPAIVDEPTQPNNE